MKHVSNRRFVVSNEPLNLMHVFHTTRMNARAIDMPSW